MNRFVKSVFVLATLAVAGCATQAQRTHAPRESTTGIVEVKLIAFNDFHGNLKTPNLRVPVADASQSIGFRLEPAGGVEQFSALVQSLKAKNPNHVVVSAGDMVGASPLLSAFFRDEPTIEAMNLVGVDIHAVGNHEFDYGSKHLKRLRDGGCAENKDGKPDCDGREPYAGSKFPFLAANVVENATGQTLFPPYVIKDFDGVKVAFIGLTLEGTPALVRLSGTAGLSFRNEVATVNGLVPEIRAKGVEAIVVVMHEGGGQGAGGGINDCKDFSGKAKELVEKFDASVEVVLTAHSHHFYICDIAGKLMTSAGSYGTLVTEIDLKINRATGKIVSKKAQNRVVDPNGRKDPALTVLLDKYTRLAAPLENRVVAKLTREVTHARGRSAGPGNGESGETALGNLIADAHLFATAAPDRGGAVISFNNPGSLRAPIIPAADGGVKYGDLFKAQPFQNDLVVMTLTGKQLRDVLEQQFNFVDYDRVLGVSTGFSYAWDHAKPRGERIVQGSMKLNGMPIQAALQYRVAVASFLADGGDGFGMFHDGTDRQVALTDLAALVEFLSANSPYTPPSLGRITRLN